MSFRSIPENRKSEPSKPKTRFHFITLIILTIVPVAIWLSINKENIHEAQETWRKRQEEKAAIEELEQEIKLLKKQQQSLTYNGVESLKHIRERLQMKFPGEKVLYFQDADSVSSQTLKSTETQNLNPTKNSEPHSGSAQDAPKIQNPSGPVKSAYDFQ